MILEPPAVNRSGEKAVSYAWKQNGSVSGYGPTNQVALQQGENNFTVEVTDEEAYPYSTKEANITITAETEFQADAN